MTLEESITDAVAAAVAPLRAQIERMTDELRAVREAMPLQLVPLKEAARRMSVSEKTAGRRFAKGEWPGRREGRKILIDLSQLRPLSDEEVARKAFRLRAVGGGRDAKKEESPVGQG